MASDKPRLNEPTYMETLSPLLLNREDKKKLKKASSEKPLHLGLVSFSQPLKQQQSIKEIF
jgi:hypothetical protein